MFCWAKIAVCLAVVSGLSSAVMSGGSIDEFGAVTDCESFKALRDQTAALFRRPLSKREYESRNFMWLRCRSDETHLFDMGGTWFGRAARTSKSTCETGST